MNIEQGISNREVNSPKSSLGHSTFDIGHSAVRFTPPSRIFVLGVGHRLSDSLFSLTEKDFQTPFGLTKSDKATVQRLRASAPAIISTDDFVHRSEHSIEFQVLFLQHLFPEASFSIVPILCGSISPFLPEYTRSAYLDKAGPFLEALRSVIAEETEKSLIIAGVDLSHIGLKFGHESPAANLEPQASAHDQRLLECLREMDAEGFWAESARTGDRYNVCGFSALALLLEILPRSKGRVLSYDCRHEAPTRSAVSFASVVFREEIRGQRGRLPLRRQE